MSAIWTNCVSSACASVALSCLRADDQSPAPAHDAFGPAQMARVMQSLGRHYVRYVNDRYRRTGTLWDGRYKACLVDSEAYLLRCCRYIELKPAAGTHGG